MKPRKWTKDEYITLLLLAAAVILIYAWHPGCFWQKTFGKECVGCGISRGCAALAKLHFATAWRYNPLTFSVPFWAAALVTLGRPFENRRANRIFRILLLAATAVLAGFRVYMMIFFPR